MVCPWDNGDNLNSQHFQPSFKFVCFIFAPCVVRRRNLLKTIMFDWWKEKVSPTGLHKCWSFCHLFSGYSPVQSVAQKKFHNITKVTFCWWIVHIHQQKGVSELVNTLKIVCQLSHIMLHLNINQEKHLSLSNVKIGEGPSSNSSKYWFVSSYIRVVTGTKGCIKSLIWTYQFLSLPGLSPAN